MDGPVVYFRLELCSGLNISIVHLAPSVILGSYAVVQGLELCNHISPVGMLPCPLDQAYFVPVWGQESL